MIFNATYLADESEIGELKSELELLAEHTTMPDDGGGLDVFCSFLGQKKKLIIAPINGNLPRIVHCSRPHIGGDCLELSVSQAPKSEYYVVSLDGSHVYDIYYSPLKELSKFFTFEIQGGQDESS